MRAALCVVVVVLGACDLSPPCQKAAKAVCDVGREGDACAYLLGAGRGDERAQDACRRVLPAAVALQANPRDEAVNAAWEAQRAELVALGFRPEPRKGQIGEQLKAAGGTAGDLVDKAERVTREGEQQHIEAAERAFDAEKQ